MRASRAIIGTAAGSVILAVGIASLVSNIGLGEFDIDDTYESGAIIPPFTLRAPEGTVQGLVITAESFDTALYSGNATAAESHEGRAELEWAHGPEAVSSLEITNTGPGSLAISGTLYSEREWIFVTYDFFVMISGLVIIGFSAGFGRRRPRGF